MKKADIKLGSEYLARVSGCLVRVKVTSEADKGWYATNVRTGREVHVKSAQRLRPILPPGEKWTPEEVARRKARAEAGRGRGTYPGKPLRTGACARCGEKFHETPDRMPLFCDRYCRAAFYDYPTNEELKSWAVFDGDCEATDGCRVEPDGMCPHGCPSWLKVYKLV